MFRLTRSVLVRVLLLVPWLVPNVAVGLLWLWLLDANLGLVNHLITAVGGSSQGFFSTPALAMPTIAMINTWQYTGYTALLFYAGMLQIPPSLYESARLDGAGEIRTFTRITLPLMRPILALVLIVSMIGSFQIFDTISITPTQGGPVNATRAVYYYIYQLAFTQFRMGYACAVAMTLVLILGLLTFVQMRLLRASRSDLA
jgi:multiple sugar transport system permease protein